MNSWNKNPPTPQEWRNAKNHGMWWVKFRLCEDEWYTDIVSIVISYKERLFDDSQATLYAKGHVIGSFKLSDPEKTKDVYWQPVKPPLDDSDKEPI